VAVGGAALGLSLRASTSRAISKQAPPLRPNIVLILADDLGWMDLHCQGNELVDTPNLDRLASQGMRFTDAYAAAPVCTPTRAAIMTGQSPARLGITNHAPGHPSGFAPRGAAVGEADNAKYLPLKHVTIAERLNAAGYATGFIGKWHLSCRRGQRGTPPFEAGLRPEHQGFDLNVGGCDYGGPPSYFDPYRNPAITDRRAGEYLPERLADESIAFMTANRDRPFFLALWNYAVHYPRQAPADLLAKYGKRKGRGIKIQAYAAMVEGLDRALGRVFKALDTLDLADNTLVIFTSDNGSLDGDNRPLRGVKGYLYEGGIRVPWIVRWPGQVKPGTMCTTPIISTDLYPTLLQAAGLAPEAGKVLDGESIVPLLRQTGRLQRDAIYWHYPNYAFHKENRLGSAIREGRFKLIKHYDDNSVELYDLGEDIGERNDLAAELPVKARRMREKLERWLRESGAKLPKPALQT
jgi:arylsulfatase A-like enzyme